MKNGQLTRHKAARQPEGERIKNFLEVALGFSEEDARKEAARCLQCKEPACVKGCPVEIDIPAFIKLIKEGSPESALLKIKEKNNLPAVCGRVCPQENQCEVACVLNKKKIPINIGTLERYASDYGSIHSNKEHQAPNPQHQALNAKHQTPNTNNSVKVVVVGSGPAGLTCAADLAKMGYKVIIYESLHLAGGVLVYGIPEFRLPKKIVREEIGYIKSLGVKVLTDVLVGRTFILEDLFAEGASSVFIATGAGLPQFLGIPGENLCRVYSANEFLTRVNLMKAYRFPEYATPLSLGNNVVVIGGGNVAVDCARVSLRLGKAVSLVYRRAESQMPARAEEVQNAREEGVIFKLLTQPVRITGDEKGVVKGLECITMELGGPDSSGRKRPVPVKGSNFILEADTVISAIGQNPNPLLPAVTPGLKKNENQTIWADENYMTSIPGVFAGGDIVTGADTVIRAMGAGKKAAAAIENYIKRTGK